MDDSKQNLPKKFNVFKDENIVFGAEDANVADDDER